MMEGDNEKTAGDATAGPPASKTLEYEQLSLARLMVILFPVTLTYFLLLLDTSIIATAIPQITSHFHSLLDVGWYGSAYQLGYAAFQPMSGKLYTYFDTKCTFLIFFAVFELGSVLCAAAASSTMLIVGRAVAGLGSSVLMNGALTIISDCVPPHRQPLIMGMNMALGQLGTACGPLIGGALTEKVSWRWCFYINLPIGGVVFLMVLLTRLPTSIEKPRARDVIRTVVKSLDLFGFVLIAPAVVMLLLALTWGGNQYPWDSSRIIGLFIGAGVTFLAFLGWEYTRGDGAMIPLSLLRMRVIWSAAGTLFFFYGVMFSFNYYLPIYFQVVKNDSALMSGVHMLPNILAQVLLAVTAGALVQRFGYYLPFIVLGTALMTIGSGVLSMIGTSTPEHDLIGYQIIFGAGIGLSVSIPFITIPNLIPRPQIPTAMAIVIFSQFLGGAVMLSAAQTIFSNSLRHLLAEDLSATEAGRIIESGARSVRDIVSGTQLTAVLDDYSTAIDRIFYMGIGLGGVAFLFCWGLGWRDIRQKKDVTTEENQMLDGLEVARSASDAKSETGRRSDIGEQSEIGNEPSTGEPDALDETQGLSIKWKGQ
ncbi:hypothetical protein BDW74DRAFT_183735 [Aspergillus multicolor]|uniref:MDR family MFS transporter n=1 Tax=Aspergillus multicolor TaxID=41759 RepID=UPI003CCCF96E